MGSRKKDRLVTGQEIESWTVLEYGSPKSLCRCSCGVEKYLYNGELNNSRTSCCRACAYRKRRGIVSHIPRLLYDRLYLMVCNAVYRCTDKTSPDYKDYGGRGISICQEWLEDRKKFALYLTTLKGHEDRSLMLDRRDNSRGYESGNLRFVTPSMSNYNRRRWKCKSHRAWN